MFDCHYSGVMGKEVILRILCCLERFQTFASNDGKRRVQVSTFFSLQLIIAGFTLFIWNNSRFAEDVLFYPNNEVLAFPKTDIKWDWVSDVNVYINSDVVVWFWRCWHVRTRQTSKNQLTNRDVWCKKNSHGWNEIGSTAGRVNLIVWLSYLLRVS